MPRELALKTKISLLRYVQAHSERDTAKKFKVSKTTVHNIKVRKAEYISRYRTGNRMYRRKCIRTKNVKINFQVLRWYRKMTSRNIQVTGAMLQRRALKCAHKLKITSFMASNGWLECFKKRYLVKNMKRVKAKAKKSKTRMAAVVDELENTFETVAEEDVDRKLDDVDSGMKECTDTVENNSSVTDNDDTVPHDNTVAERIAELEKRLVNYMMPCSIDIRYFQQNYCCKNEPEQQGDLNDMTVQDDSHVSEPDTDDDTTAPIVELNQNLIDYIVPYDDIDFLLYNHENEHEQLIDLKDIKIEPQNEEIDQNWEDIVMPDLCDFLKRETADEDENNNESHVKQQDQNEDNS